MSIIQSAITKAKESLIPKGTNGSLASRETLSRSTKLSKQISDDIDAITARYDDLYRDQKYYNPLTSSVGKTVLSYYAGEGQKAAADALASAAGENTGNPDSYAVANGERQKMAKLSEGVAAAADLGDRRFDNMLSTLKALGVDVTGLRDADVRNIGNALDSAGTLYKADSDRAADRRKSDNEKEAAAYKADSDLRSAKIKAASELLKSYLNSKNILYADEDTYNKALQKSAAGLLALLDR